MCEVGRVARQLLAEWYGPRFESETSLVQA